MAAIENIHLPDQMRHITLHVRVTGQWRTAVRVWLGTRLLLLAAIVMGTGIDIES